MIKAIAFDLDHTLFDRYETLKALMPAFCKRFDVALDAGAIYSLLSEHDKKLNYQGWEVVHEQLCRDGVFKTCPSFAQYKEFLLHSFCDVSVDYPFTKPTLVKLRESGYKLGIITNGNHKTQYAKIGNLGYEPFFDEIIVSGDFEYEKPDAGIFFEMTRRFRILPQEMLYVGDNPINDITGAHNAGCPAVWVKTTGTWIDTELPAEYEVNNVSELPALLETINQ